MKDLFRLDGKVAVVIGGAGGIGQGIAEAMAFYGAEVVIASRKMESLVRAKSEIDRSIGWQRTIGRTTNGIFSASLKIRFWRNMMITT